MSVVAKPKTVNVADRMSAYAQQAPDQLAVVEAVRRGRNGKYQYRQMTYTELDEDSNRIASALHEMGITPGTRLVLLVRPGIDFVSLVFAMFKAGVVTVLIDPGMGRKNLLRCLEETEPEGFVAVPEVHAVRTVLRRRFPRSRFHVTAGRRWFWGGMTLDQLRRRGSTAALPWTSKAEDPAAIIFTTGSTGVPKGVLYRHGNFDQQVEQIQRHYNIEAGAVDLAAFPLFGLFNSGMGATTVIPDMDATRPARADPRKIIAAITDWQATQSFASPALWHVLGRYCQTHDVKLPTLRRVFSAGAPVPGRVLASLKEALPENAEIYTPYGATEALPVASISASEVLNETQSLTDEGAGVCVGKKFSGIDWRVIEIVDGPVRSIDQARLCRVGEIGELIVSGPVVTTEYVTRREANNLGKIQDGERIWHRMGDVGYLDDEERFWFCGRMAHRVRTPEKTLFTVRCEAVFNTHPDIYRSALVGVGTPGRQLPVIVVEPFAERFPRSAGDRDRLMSDLRELAMGHAETDGIRHFLFHRGMPVDIRHNAKIFREKLAVWASRKIRRSNGGDPEGVSSRGG